MYVFMYRCASMYVCMHVDMYVFINVCRYVCMYVNTAAADMCCEEFGSGPQANLIQT